MKTIKLISGITVAALAALADTGVPEVSSVAYSQNTPGSRLVTVTYTIANAPAIVTLDVLTNDVSIGSGNIRFLSGDVNKLVGVGTHTIAWQADKSWPEHKISEAIVKVRVNAWATNTPPDYLVVDLLDGTNLHYYVSAEALPDGGLSNEAYRTTRIVLRKIAAKGVTWTMGSTEYTNSARMVSREKPQNVTLANDYYAGVFEVTQGQWATLKNGNRPSHWTMSYAGRPVEGVSFYDIRESTDNAANTAYQYPNPPNPASFLGLLRAKTGLAFDLPGEAQWEYACRAGHYEGEWNNGSSLTDTNNIALLARYQGNSGAYLADSTLEPAEGGTATVGSYLPNSWGLYDMHGNVFEWCLDWFKEDIYGTGGAIVLTDQGKGHAYRGGSYTQPWSFCRSAFRTWDKPDVRKGDPGIEDIGFRVFYVLP